MSEIIQWCAWLVQTICFGVSELATMLISMVPMIELKGGIPIAVNNYGLGHGEAFWWAFLGSSLVSIPLYFLCKLLFKIKFFKRLENIVRDKAKSVFSKTRELESTDADKRKIMLYKCLGVFLFVVIPIPLTGVWTGTLVAFLLGLRFWQMLPVIFVGNAIGGALILGLTWLLGDYLDYLIFALFIIALVLLLILLWKLFKKSSKSGSGLTLILASSFNSNDKDENGERFAIPMTDKNDWISNIKKYTTKYNRAVIVASNPEGIELNDMYGNLIFESLALSGLDFKEKIFVDSRNKNKAKEILSGANLIMLSGGRVDLQMKFFNEIGIKEIIDRHNGLVMGGSAGAMNLCQTVFNFPEFKDEVDNRKDDEFFESGLGYHNEIIIPHFDGKQFMCDCDLDVVKDYFLPLSKGREFIALTDESYILISEGKPQYFGDFFKIKDGKIKKISFEQQ